MRYFSTFTGIGGFELGIDYAYEALRDVDRGENRRGEADPSRAQGQRLLPPEGKRTGTAQRPAGRSPADVTEQRPLCVGYSEVDPYACSIYQRHFPTYTNYGDITKINADELPDFDLLVGGFPCQAFSIAGKRRGFEDTRGTLFFDLARILRAKRPRLFVFENVKGLLSHDGGRTFKTIVATTSELGYDIQWQVLNSKNHGVPQNRERVFIIGHLRGEPRPQVFPLGEINQHPETPCREERQAIPSTVRAKQGGPDLENSYEIRVPEATKQGYADAKTGDSINLQALASKTRRGRVGRGIANTLDTSMQQHTLTGPRIRRLTPTECERLQGFPDGWTETGVYAGNPTHFAISDTQRYKVCGNAVTVNVIRDLMLKLL